MSKVQILFAEDDPYGHNSGVDSNYDNHVNKFGALAIDIDKYYPRGSAYWKLFNTQADNECNKLESDYD